MQDRINHLPQFEQCYYRVVLEWTFETQSLIGCPIYGPRFTSDDPKARIERFKRQSGDYVPPIPFFLYSVTRELLLS